MLKIPIFCQSQEKWDDTNKYACNAESLVLSVSSLALQAAQSKAGFISLSYITDLLHCQSSTIAVIINHLIWFRHWILFALSVYKMKNTCKDQILMFLSLVLCLDSAKLLSFSFCSLSSLVQIKNSIHSNFSFLKSLQDQCYYSFKCLGSRTNTKRHSLYIPDVQMV